MSHNPMKYDCLQEITLTLCSVEINDHCAEGMEKAAHSWEETTRIHMQVVNNMRTNTGGKFENSTVWVFSVYMYVCTVIWPKRGKYNEYDIRICLHHFGFYQNSLFGRGLVLLSNTVCIIYHWKLSLSLSHQIKYWKNYFFY